MRVWRERNRILFNDIYIFFFIREQLLHKVLGNVLTTFLEENAQNPSINITLAKSVFVQNGIDVQEDFKNGSSAIYGSEFQSVDFTNPNASDILNQ